MNFNYDITTPKGEIVSVNVNTDSITDAQLAADAVLLNAVRDFIIKSIMTQYNTEQQSAFSYMNYDIQADSASQIMMSTQLTLGATSWARIGFWKTFTNDKLTIDFTQLNEMCELLNLRNSILFNAKETLKLQASAAVNIADFQSVWNTISTIDHIQANRQALTILNITSVSSSAP